jgi:hypothetical protein
LAHRTGTVAPRALPTCREFSDVLNRVAAGEEIIGNALRFARIAGLWVVAVGA